MIYFNGLLPMRTRLVGADVSSRYIPEAVCATSVAVRICVVTKRSVQTVAIVWPRLQW